MKKITVSMFILLLFVVVFNACNNSIDDKNGNSEVSSIEVSSIEVTTASATTEEEKEPAETVANMTMPNGDPVLLSPEVVPYKVPHQMTDEGEYDILSESIIKVKESSNSSDLRTLRLSALEHSIYGMAMYMDLLSETNGQVVDSVCILGFSKVYYDSNSQSFLIYNFQPLWLNISGNQKMKYTTIKATQYYLSDIDMHQGTAFEHLTFQEALITSGGSMSIQNTALPTWLSADKEKMQKELDNKNRDYKLIFDNFEEPYTSSVGKELTENELDYISVKTLEAFFEKYTLREVTY